MSGYREKDAAHDTRVTERQATAAWHQARDDSSVRSEGGGDRPTAQNYVDASPKLDEVMTRARTGSGRSAAIVLTAPTERATIARTTQGETGALIRTPAATGEVALSGREVAGSRR
jgi:hypothetical protein